MPVQGRKRRNPFDDFFTFDFEEVEKMMDNLMRRGFEDMRSGKPLVYGFNIRTGPDGKPVIEEFGNVKPGKQGPEISDEREPLVDVLEHDEDITVIAELPGVKKDDIKADFKDSTLEISVNTPEHKYYKNIELPAKVDRKNSKASYKNGVLEIVIKKLVKSKPASGIKIR